MTIICMQFFCISFFCISGKETYARISTYYYSEQLVYRHLLFKIFIRGSTVHSDLWKPQVVWSFWTSGYFLTWGTWILTYVTYIMKFAMETLQSQMIFLAKANGIYKFYFRVPLLYTIYTRAQFLPIYFQLFTSAACFHLHFVLVGELYVS